MNKVGIDVLETKRMEDYIKRELPMEKIFTAYEIEYIKRVAKSASRMAGIFSAKEAFLKAIGVGIGDERFPLNSLDFSNSIYSSSQYSIYEGYYKNMLLEGWVFVTIMLDDIHILGIACGPKQEKIENDKIVNCNKLEISLDSIILENHVIYKANGNCTIHITYSDISMLL